MKNFIRNLLRELLETVRYAINLGVCALLIFVMLYASTPRTIQHETVSTDITELM